MRNSIVFSVIIPILLCILVTDRLIKKIMNRCWKWLVGLLEINIQNVSLRLHG